MLIQEKVKNFATILTRISLRCSAQKKLEGFGRREKWS